jgi:hypothetical protein
MRFPLGHLRQHFPNLVLASFEHEPLDSHEVVWTASHNPLLQTRPE